MRDRFIKGRRRGIGLVLVVGGVCGLVACGGASSDAAPEEAAPGGSVRVSGVVATGHALNGARVATRCAAGAAATTSSAADGRYALALERAALPCVLEAVSADGLTVLHSVALERAVAGAGGDDVLAHITPLTELLVAQLAGTPPAVFMRKAGATALHAAITPEGIARAQTAVLGVLRQMAIRPSGLTDVLAQPLVAATATSAGDAHDHVLDALAAAMRGSGAQLADLVSLIYGRRSLTFDPPAAGDPVLPVR